MKAEDFFTGLMSTARRDDELIEAVSFPCRRSGEGFAFREFARRHGDFAIVACAAVATERNVRLAVGGVADRPVVRDFGTMSATMRCAISLPNLMRATICTRPPTIAAIWCASLAHKPSRRRADAAPERRRAPHRPPRNQRPRGRGRSRAAHAAHRFPAPQTRPHRHACRLRARRVRRLHDPDRRRARARLPHARRAGRRREHPHRRRSRAGARPPLGAAGSVPPPSRAAMRLLHGGHPDVARLVFARHARSETKRACANSSQATSAAAPAMCRSSRPRSMPRSGCAKQERTNEMVPVFGRWRDVVWDDPGRYRRQGRRRAVG